MIQLSVDEAYQVWLIAIAVFAIPAWIFTAVTWVLIREANKGRKEHLRR